MDLEQHKPRLFAAAVGVLVGAIVGFSSSGLEGAILGAIAGGLCVGYVIFNIGILYDQIPIWTGPTGRILGITVIFVLLIVLLWIIGRS
jgi:hypothetical protein